MSEHLAVAEQKRPSPAPTLQRTCACGRPITAGGECTECRKKRLQRQRNGLLQRRAVTDHTPDVAPPIVHEVLRSPGRPLDAETRAFMEPRFGHDFSGVRVHTDARATESARTLNAHAYTVGKDIVFNKGTYAPRTPPGCRLLAHELAHTLQQKNAPGLMRSELKLAPSTDVYEREAEHAAAYIAKGNSAPPRLSFTRQVVQRACGPAAIGSVSGCVGVGGQDVFELGIDSNSLYFFNVNCDEFLPGEEARLQSFAAMPEQTVEVHGFASEEGDPVFNENLSCARALATANILRGEGVTVSATIFQHGATPGDRPAHRSVVILPITSGSGPSRQENCSELIDGCDFYQCRERQHPCGERGYYIGYGYKYCNRFSQLEERLSAPGQDWVRQTRRCLMDHVDRNIPIDAPCASVKQSAFDSHPVCYVRGGVCFLNSAEWAQILGVIDSQDNDLKQALLTGVFCFGNWAPVGLFPQHSLGAGGGYRGLMERDRQRTRRLMQQRAPQQR